MSPGGEEEGEKDLCHVCGERHSVTDVPSGDGEGKEDL